MSKHLAYRQGDVTLVLTTAFPEDDVSFNQKKLDAKGRVVLAEGEATGHAHVMDKDVAKLFVSPTKLPEGHSLLVVAETTVKRDSLIEGKVLETLKDGTIRFQQSDGVVIRFAPTDVKIMGDIGVYVNRAYSLLKHDEHDAIPVGAGTYRVMQHQQATSARRRMITGD